MGDRKRRNACICCGRSNWIRTRDNFGDEYIGCANCVSSLPPDLPGTWQDFCARAAGLPDRRSAIIAAVEGK